LTAKKIRCIFFPCAKRTLKKLKLLAMLLTKILFQMKFYLCFFDDKVSGHEAGKSGVNKNNAGKVLPGVEKVCV